MKYYLIFLVWLCVLAPQHLYAQSLIGYLPAYRKFDKKKVDLLTDLILFSAEPQRDGTLKLDDGLIRHLEKLGQVNSDKKVFLCVGGWGKSEHFLSVTKDSTLRKRLVDHVVLLVKKYGLAGVDYDWEHPKTNDQLKQYQSLIQETAKRGILVSVAVGGWIKFDQEVFQYLHRVNIMSYDYPERHSTFESAKKDIDSFLKQGCPSSKITLGVPLYGRHIKNRKTKTYAELSQLINNETSDEVDGYYFNNVQTLKKKTDLVMERGLNGVMVWEIEQDSADLKLLKKLHDTLKINKKTEPSK